MHESPRSFKDLTAWQRAQDLFVGIYRLMEHVPRADRYWIAPQLCDAALSVASNIAEGKGREHLREYLHHLSYSRGSSNEVESQLISLRRAKIVPATLTEPLEAQCEEVSRMVYVMATNLRRQMPRRRGR